MVSNGYYILELCVAKNRFVAKNRLKALHLEWIVCGSKGQLPGLMYHVNTSFISFQPRPL